MKRLAAIRFTRALAAAGLLAAGGACAAPSCGVGETAVPFAFTGAEQTAVVPPGVHSVKVHLFGAQGGAGASGNGNVGGDGGLGGEASGTLAVAPGQVLSVWVGGQGSLAVNPGGQGGLNPEAGDVRAGNGGGATDLRVGGSAVADRVAIAAGGGGGGSAGWGGTLPVPGGVGGRGGSGGSGAAGVNVSGGAPNGLGPFGGGGGVIGSGGSAGAGCDSYPPTPGSPAGDGGVTRNFSGSFPGAGAGGGGGGGATVGGGGGGGGVGTSICMFDWNAGGGGGSGGVSAAPGLTDAVMNDAVQSGDGAALLCFAAPVPTVTLASSPNPSAPGAAVTFTATLTDHGALTGAASVTFCADAPLTDASCGGTPPLCTAAASAPATSCTSAALAPGTHAITAYFSGDANNGAAASAALIQQVGTAPAFTSAPTTTFTLGTAGTFTVAASGVPAPAIATGGSLPAGISLVDHGDGTATLAGTVLAGVGDHALTLTATGLVAPAATQAFTLVVNQASRTMLSAAPAAAVYGQAVTLTATVDAAEAGATGTVAFAAGAAPLPGCAAVPIAPASATSSTATCTTASLAVATHALAATYAGGGHTLGSASAPVEVRVAKAATATTLTPPPAIALGQSVAVAARVAVTAPGAGAPGGTITIGDGATGAGDACTIAIAAGTSEGRCTLTPGSAGTWTLSARFVPDAASAANFEGSTATGTLQVDPAAAGVALASSANPSAFGAAVTFTATVTAPAGLPAPTGTVDFRDGAAPIDGCSGVALAGGAAACTTASLAVGRHAVQASYAGDANTAPASATLTQTVDAGRTAMTLGATPNPAGPDDVVMLTARVDAALLARRAGADAGAVPTGTVAFRDGAAELGSAALDANGTATLVAGPFAAGSHALSAAYAGDASFAPASAATVLAVNALAEPPQPVPALSWWTLLALAALLAGAARRRARR